MDAKYFIGADGNICVKNISAFWLRSLPCKKEIGGTVYSVSGSYTGTETLDKKLLRIMEHNAENMEEHQ